MKCAIPVVLAVGGLLVLGACGPNSAVRAPTATVSPSSSSSAGTGTGAGAKATSVVKKRTVTEKRSIPFATRRVKDPALAKGATRTRTRGRAGVKTLVYEVTLIDGVRKRKRLVRQVVTRKPVTMVIAVGTRQVRRCDSNYSGACVPSASDVDCAGGSGNGPAYVQGPVQVVGTDVYDLDRDGDGTACD